MKKEFVLAFNEVLEDKGLPKETILEALAQALVSAYRKSINASNAQDVRAQIDLDSGDFSILVEKEVVEEVQNIQTEVVLKRAQEFEPDSQIGDLVLVEDTPTNFGRVAAQTARQVIQQKIRDAEHSVQVEFFEKQLGEIVSGIVQASNVQGLTLGLDHGAEGIMPRREMIRHEHFRIHERARALVAEIRETGRGPQIILSRTHRDFLRRLLETEVPEIYHGIVEIRSIAREPGQRAKVAVSTSQKGIDPVGACVGRHGIRIQAIVRELHDEKIDVIEWNKDPTAFIAKAISPAHAKGVYLKETIDGRRIALVVVPEDELSLAIGRDGQNARLAAKLTGWRIDIKSLSESVSDWLFALKNREEFKSLAKEEKESIEKAEGILARKSEGRVIPIDNKDFLVVFNDRLERYAVNKQQAILEKYEEKREKILETMPEGAFKVEIESTSLPAKIADALIEAGFPNAGELVLASELKPEDLLAVPGIGPKTLERIQKITEELPGLVPEVVVEEPEETDKAAEPAEEVEAVVEDSETIEEEAAETESAAKEELVVDEGKSVADEKDTAVEKIDETKEEKDKAPEEDLSFDELFKLKPEVFDPASMNDAEEIEEGDDEAASGKTPEKKKSARKTKRRKTLEYDPDLDMTIAKKKHKRGDADWEDLVD
jgi:N utilization substance protein A